jgi:rhodanese-related sulfurtransferase
MNVYGDGVMANASRRQFLWIALGAAAVVLGANFALNRGSGSAGFETRAMTVGQMVADKALVVDVRTAQEWQDTGVIAGAKLVTFAEPESFLAAIKADLAPGQDLVLVCHSGRRSAAAAGALAGLIPNHIISVEGGMSRLISEGYQTVPPT